MFCNFYFMQIKYHLLLTSTIHVWLFGWQTTFDSFVFLFKGICFFEEIVCLESTFSSMNLSDFLFFCSFARRTPLLQDFILLSVSMITLSLRWVSLVGSCFTFTTLQKILLELTTQKANFIVTQSKLKLLSLETAIKINKILNKTFRILKNPVQAQSIKFSFYFILKTLLQNVLSLIIFDNNFAAQWLV